MERDERPRPIRPNLDRRPRGSGSDTWRTWRLRILMVVIPLVLVVGTILRFWVDLLWFAEVGQRDVVVTRLQWSTAMGVGFGLFAFAVFYANFVIARRVARDDMYVPFLAVGADPEAPEQPVIPHFVLRPILLAVASIAGVLAGLIMSARWEVVLRFLGRGDFGVTDPHFGKDASFYVFTMPLLELITRSLQTLLVLSAVGIVLVYVATGVIRYTPVPRIARAAVVHLSWIVAGFLLVSAFQFRLSIWSLATGKRGVVAGAGWTDVHARIPGYWLMLVASIALAVVVVVWARRERWRVVGSAIGGWFIASIIVTGVIPAIVQKVLVEPNELSRENKVLVGNIANTRAAFDLDSIKTAKFTDQKSLNEAQLLRDNRGTTDNLRLWSPDVLREVVHQDQSIRRYYGFNVPDVDRYTVDGDYRQLMISVRELNSDATQIAPGWTNERLAYTHGYGAVATLSNEVTKEGKPEYLLEDLSLDTKKGAEVLKLDRPEVYYGEQGNEFVIVDSKQREVSGASRDAATKTSASAAQRYGGDGGIRISSALRRVALAATFRDPRILFSGQFTSKSRLMFRRRIQERVHELAPFLQLDPDPYAVVVNGRIKWIVDAYTTSDRFPYSSELHIDDNVAEPGSTTAGRPGGSGMDVNYMRNSVKAVIDAYDGDVTLYTADSKDPILASWRDIFPTLFTPISKMPKELRAHVRYPEQLFEQQTQLWQRYHMSDVADFYRRDDQWDVPTIGGKPLAAYYVLAKLPGAKDEELLLIRPLTPATKKNMVSYMVAQSDGDNYGKVSTLVLSSQTVTQGPSQVQALIKQDTDVARQVREWTTGNNKVIFGNLLVLPVEKSLLYVQPVYLQNAEAAIPEFQKIVVVLGDTIAWGDTFNDAAEQLLQRRAAELDRPDASADTPDTAAPERPATPAPASGDFAGLSREELAQLVTAVNAAYDRADACQAKGDFVCFAREIASVKKLLADARAQQR